MKKVQRQMELLEKEKDPLIALLEDNKPIIKTNEKEKNKFIDEIRKTVVALIGQGKVPAKQVSDLIKIVSSYLFGVAFIRLIEAVLFIFDY